MRAPRAGKGKTPRRQKGLAKRNGRVHTRSRDCTGVRKPTRELSQSEHLQGLWVTLGLADVSD